MPRTRHRSRERGVEFPLPCSAAVGRRTGWAVLANTSFNVRGKPILNNVARALGLLDEGNGLGAVLLEGSLVWPLTS